MNNNWKTKQFSKIVSSVSLTNKKLKKGDYLETGNFPVIDQGQDKIGGYSNDESKLIKGKRPFVVFGDHTRCVKFIDFPFVPGADGVKVFKIKENIEFDEKCLYYFMQAVKLPDKGYSRHYKYLKKAEIPIPPLPEQRRIVAKIEELFSQLDAGVKDLKKIQKQLEQYRQSVLKAAFEGKLTDTSTGKDWEEAELQEFTEVNPRKTKFENDGMEVSFLPMKAVEEKIGKSDLSEIRKYGKVKRGYTQFFDGDVIFAKITPCMENGKIAVVSNLKNGVGFGSTEFIVIRPDTEKSSATWIFYYLLQENYRINAKKFMQGTSGHMRVPKDYVKETKIPLPRIQEQELVIMKIEEQFSIINHLKKVAEESLEKAENLRQSILKKAFEGRLV